MLFHWFSERVYDMSTSIYFVHPNFLRDSRYFQIHSVHYARLYSVLHCLYSTTLV